MADITDADFETAVVERSKTVPVVVDLWAEWCGPCKTLGPILEKVIGETNGLVELAKIDVDANPQVAQLFKVQSIPAVYALKDGRVVDGFMGAVPEAEIVAFVQKLLDGETASTDEESEESETPEAVISEPSEEAAPAQEPELSTAEISGLEARLEGLLVSVKQDDAAREEYVELLDTLAASNPDLAGTWRRRLAAVLF